MANESATINESTAPLETYNWKDFSGENGKARHLWSAGILNTGLKPEMLTEEGYAKESKNEKHDIKFYIQYDKDYVSESFCKMLKQLGIIENGKVDRDLLGILFDQLTEYTEGFANRDSEKVLQKKAEDLAHQFPGAGGAEYWLNVIKAELEKQKKEPPAEETKASSSKTKTTK